APFTRDGRGPGAEEAAVRVGQSLVIERRHQISSRRRGTRLTLSGMVLNALPPMLGIDMLVPVSGTFGPVAASEDCAVVEAVLPVIVFRTTSTGMSRMFSFVSRSLVGQRSVTSNDRSPSFMVVKGLPPTAVEMTSFNSLTLMPHKAHFSRSTGNV